MGEPQRGGGGRETIGGQGLGGRRKLREKRERETQRGRERDTERQGEAEREKPRDCETEMGEGEIWGRQRLVAEGSWRERHTQRNIQREKGTEIETQREKPRDWGTDGGWGKGEDGGGSGWDDRRKEETGTESSREGEERQMGRDRQRLRMGERTKQRKAERNWGVGARS